LIMLRRLSLAVAVASAFAGTAWAANAPLSAKTDLVTVYKDAVDNNADLAAARANFEAQREAVPQARAGLLPQINGGASANDLLMQFQADLLGIPVLRPQVIETTALGAALLAGLGAGVYGSPDEIGGIWQLDRAFEPRMSRDEAAARLALWDRAVRQVLAG